MTISRRVAAIAPFMMLAACSGEPSESEMREAADVMLAQIGSIVARGMRPLRIDDFEEQGCTKAEGATFVCDVTVTISGGRSAVPQTRTGPMRFTKSGDGWIASE